MTPPVPPYIYISCLLKLNLYKSVFVFTTLSLPWVSLSSVKSLYDPILVLSLSRKIVV